MKRLIAATTLALSVSAWAQNTVIDILLVYTQELNPPDEQVQALFTETNNAYKNNAVPIRVRLVGQHQTQYAETNDSNQTLIKMQNPNDGVMDDVPVKRNEVGADIILVMSSHTTGCGDAVAAPVPSDSEWAFIFVSTGCWAGEYVFAHEMGHTMGSLHIDRAPNIMLGSASTNGIFLPETIELMTKNAPILAAWRPTVVPPSGC